MNEINNANPSCETCYQIKCKQCGWIATDEDAFKIQQGELTACPQRD